MIRTVESKLADLKNRLADSPGLLVAFSGGVDSTLLLKIAMDVLDTKILAVTVRTTFMSDDELSSAEDLAHQLGTAHQFQDIDILDDPTIADNPPDRCYHCKLAIFTRLSVMAKELGYDLADGSNADDLLQYRPGLKALSELHVRSPLAEANLTKDEIRTLSRALGLPTWDKPSQPCLATRFPYGHRISSEQLRRVEEAESFLHSLGFSLVRVRTHDTMARIEVPTDEMTRLLIEHAAQIVDRLKSLGYTHVALDLEGYRSGSMDKIIGR